MVQKTTQQFIEEAIAVHGDAYDYSKVDYKKSESKVIIFCKKCNNEFLQRPCEHSRGKGCSNCRYNSLRFTREQVIEKAKKIYGENMYNFDNIVYKNIKTKITVNCLEHGDFITTPHRLLNGSGCIKCFYKKITATQDDFIEKAKKKHGDKYDYSKVEYKNNLTKVIIICREHGEFQQLPGGHLTGYGCRKCSVLDRTNTKEYFIENAKKIHGDRYDYSKVEYKNAETNIIIICKEHGDFLQRPNIHITGNGCSKCSLINRTKTTEYFIEKSKKAHGDRYDYSKVEYKNMKTKVNIICREHGEFLQRPIVHYSGYGCSNCSKKTEYKLFENIKKYYPNTIREFSPKWFDTHNYRYDFYIPEHSLIIELDGDQRFRQVRNWKTPEETRKLDIYKQNKAVEKGYSVIRILQNDVFYDKNNWLNTLLEKIKELSKSNEKKVIYICSNNEYQIFIDEENKLVV